MAHSLPHDIPRLFIDLIEILKKCRKRELEELGDYYIQSKKVDAESFREAQNASKIMKKQYSFLPLSWLVITANKFCVWQYILSRLSGIRWY